MFKDTGGSTQLIVATRDNILFFVAKRLFTELKMGCCTSTQSSNVKIASQNKRDVANTTAIETTTSNDKLVLRFLAINDVYLLKNLPYYCTAKKLEAIGADLVVGTLAGDFLMPSELSSIDKGMSIVDCLGKAGVDYVCLGTHRIHCHKVRPLLYSLP